MALKITNMTRVFTLNKGKTTLPDPNPEMEAEEVMAFYATQYPELTNSNVSGPEIKDGKAVYKFQTIIGDKG